MKKVFFLFLLMPVLAIGQIADDFESGSLEKWMLPISGHWKAETTNTITGSYSLHHSYDNSQSGYDQAGLSLEDLKPSSGTTKWSFTLRYGYAPSSSNNWSIFLMSDASPSSMMPGGNVNGFAVGVNLSGYDDTLRLWKLKNGTVTKLLSSGVNWERDIGINSIASIIVERSPLGEWKISVLKGSSQTSWTARNIDNELFSARWFGIYYKYTSTCDRLLWVDDIKIDGVFFTDSVPPHPDTLYVAGKNKIVISFDEPPDFTRMSRSDFVLTPEGLIASDFRVINERSVEVTYSSNFKNKTENELLIRTLCDSIPNCVNDISVFFTPIWADIGDVIITEIMADPVPSVGLPQKEYFEITNNTAFAYDLKGWSINTGSTITWFPEISIKQNEILILCSIADTSFFKSYGRVIGLKSFPVLTDQGKLLIIYNQYNDLIHGVEYTSDWYGDVLKSAGGWSLEMIDAGYPFYYEGNWTASVSRSGGTPGTQNSVQKTNRDKFCPVALNVFPVDSVSISVQFSEPVLIKQDMLSGIKIGGRGIASFKKTDPLSCVYTFSSSEPFAPGVIYELEFSDRVTDYSRNSICQKNFPFGVPEPAIRDDIQFNELLFNPYSDATDYIEFYNCSEKVIDAATLMIVSIADVTNDTSEYMIVSEDHRCILPNTYYVITTNKEELLNRYFSSQPNAIFVVENLISMSDDKGHLVVLNKELDVIDEVLYNEEMHFALLSDFEGVALEKVRQCITSEDRANWHSAAESSGWGTPGISNSAFTNEPIINDRVSFSSTKISPDNDGFEDILVIDFQFETAGNVITIAVFDDMGYLIKELANNSLVGMTSSLIWDGTDNNGSIAGSGIYIIYYSGFDETGKVTNWKKVCTVIMKR